MQKQLLNISLLSLGFIFTLHSCIRVKKASSEGLSDFDKKYLLKIERQFKNDSLTKIEYAVKKSDLLLRRREYDKAIKFYESLDSLDVGYFKYPIEKKILLNDIMILKYNKEEKFIERDSLITYMRNYFNNEDYKSHSDKTKDIKFDSNFISEKKIQMVRMLWVYEDISLNNDDRLKDK